MSLLPVSGENNFNELSTRLSGANGMLSRIRNCLPHKTLLTINLLWYIFFEPFLRLSNLGGKILVMLTLNVFQFYKIKQYEYFILKHMIYQRHIFINSQTYLNSMIMYPCTKFYLLMITFNQKLPSLNNVFNLVENSLLWNM